MVKNEIKLIEALAGGPIPAFEVMGLVSLIKKPGVFPLVTLTLNVQVPPPAIVAPVRVMVVVVADRVPEQVGVAATGVTVTPGGVSVKPTPVRGVFGFGLVMLNANMAGPPRMTVDGL